MPEATMILLDNSAYSINGDYNPTRWLNQIDAAGLLIETKMEQERDTAIGVGLTAGKQVEIVCTPCMDIGQVTSTLYGIKQHGLINICQGLMTGALALKHRANASLKQRIVCFVASPLGESVEQLKIVCKKLKKNGIALDLIGMGDLSEVQKKKLTAMHEEVNKEDNSTLLFVEPEANVSDMIIGSKMLTSNAQMFGQPNEAEDADLLRALQLSLLESEQDNHMRAQHNEEMVSEDDLQQRAIELALQEPEEKQGDKQGDKQEEQDDKQGGEESE